MFCIRNVEFSLIILHFLIFYFHVIFCNLIVYLLVLCYVSLFQNGLFFMSLSQNIAWVVLTHDSVSLLQLYSAAVAQFVCVLAVVDPGFIPKGFKTPSS